MCLVFFTPTVIPMTIITTKKLSIPTYWKIHSILSHRIWLHRILFYWNPHPFSFSFDFCRCSFPLFVLSIHKTHMVCTIVSCYECVSTLYICINKFRVISLNLQCHTMPYQAMRCDANEIRGSTEKWNDSDCNWWREVLKRREETTERGREIERKILDTHGIQKSEWFA